MMSETPSNADETQPVRVPSAEIDFDGAPSDRLPEVNSARTDEIPEWLTEFAAQPAQESVAIGERHLPPVEDPGPEPVVLQTTTWQPEPTAPSSTPVDKAQVFDALLQEEQYSAAADLIRKTATTSLQVEASLRALRPHLILKEKFLPLWDVYEELSQKIWQENNQTKIGG